MQSVPKEARYSADLRLQVCKIDLAEAIIITFGDGSWGNAKAHRTQAGYCSFVAEKGPITESGGKSSLLDWRSHRLRRACGSSPHAESMASRAAAASGTWLQLFMREALISPFRATMFLPAVEGIEGDSSVISCDPEVYEAARKLLPLHVVTDCDSLHEIVVKSGLPEDKRAAIEVLVIREMILGEDACDSDIDPTIERMCEHNLKDYYHWTVSEDQMADALTKVIGAEQRREWMENLNWISIRQSKKKELRLQKNVPVKPRQPIDRAYAKLVVQAEGCSKVGKE